MLWENCLLVQLYKFIYLKDNFTQFCQLQITFQKANDIVKNFIEQDKTNTELLRQHFYVNLCPKLHLCYNRFGIHNKSIFEYTYCDWYFQKTKYKQSPRKDQTDSSSSSSKNSGAKVAAAGKIPALMSKGLQLMLINLNSYLKK